MQRMRNRLAGVFFSTERHGVVYIVRRMSRTGDAMRVSDARVEVRSAMLEEVSLIPTRP
jgi:hypothetical protein